MNDGQQQDDIICTCTTCQCTHLRNLCHGNWNTSHITIKVVNKRKWARQYVCVTHLLQRTGCHLRCVNYTGCHIFRVLCFQCSFVNWIGAIEASCVCSDGRLCGLLVRRWRIRLTWRRIGWINNRCTGYSDCSRMWISWRWRRRTVRLRWTVLFNWVERENTSLESNWSINGMEMTHFSSYYTIRFLA